MYNSYKVNPAAPFTIPLASWVALLIAMALLALPHLQGLPWWAFIPSVISAAWLVAQLRFGLKAMPTPLRIALAFATLAVAVGSYRNVQSLDMYVALLMMLQAQKTLEMQSARDLYVTVFIGFIAAVTRLLYVQAFSDMFIAVVTSLVLLSALYSRYQQGVISPWQSIKNILLLFLKASPLIAAFFFLFPRIPPLMVIPELSGSAKTGISGVMQPGNIAELARSREPAFRVAFEGAIPDSQQLYWRGVVMDRFDGSSWRALIKRKTAAPVFAAPTKVQGYTVSMEPSNRRWLFTLALSKTLSSDTSHYEGFIVASDKPIANQQSYQFEYAASPLPQSLSYGQQQVLTRQPPDINPEAQAWGRDLAQQYATADDIIAALSKRFSEQFSYSLNAPTLGQHSADEFLFSTKVGYCEHFAHAAAVVMRAAGIPTRVIGGYLGGELNPFESYLLVRQQDAHAWLEYWQPGQGWLRYDPTAAVAPERITAGSEQTLSLRNESSRPWSEQGLGALYQWYLWADAMNYAWARLLEEYDDKEQTSLLKNLTGLKNIGDYLLAILIGVAIVVTLPFGFVAMRASMQQNLPLALSLQLADTALRVAGLARPKAISPARWLATQQILPKSYQQLVHVWHQVWFQQLPIHVSKYPVIMVYLARCWLWAIFYHLGKNQSTVTDTK